MISDYILSCRVCAAPGMSRRALTSEVRTDGWVGARREPYAVPQMVCSALSSGSGNLGFLPRALLVAELDRDWSHDMGEREEIRSYLHELIGDEGCGASCSDAEVYEDEDGWKLNMEGFMEPWRIGRTVAEARASLKEYAHMGFGLA